MTKNKKNILITGGAGFLGSHLVDKLLKNGDNIFCLDNFYTGSKKNIEHNIESNNFNLIERDINNEIEIDDIDEIYNLACPASPVHYQYDPIFTIKTSFIGSLNVLNLAVQKKSKIFHASTSEVYGDPKISPQNELYWGNVNPIGIRSCYDEGKRAAETLFFDFRRTKEVDARVVRIFNTYGPRMNKNDGRVVSNFIVQALNGENLTIYGDGNQTRSFCYVDDLIDGFLRVMNHKKNLEAPINLGNPDEFSINELAEIVIDLTGSKSNIVNKPLPQDDPIQRKPDISFAKENLNNWEPKINLKKGIIKTISYFDEVLSGEN